ncbi:MAG: hypothetical protein ACR2QR_08470 [Woeseiaceae bacterium]
MTKGRGKQNAVVGVTEHGNSAELVTVANDGELVDRRRIDLTKGLPTHPYHHQGSWAVGRYTDSPWSKEITLPEAIGLVEQVQEASKQGAVKCLEALVETVPATITGIAIRACPELPATIEECIRDNRAQAVADTVMYRQALAAAAEARGWAVFWYDREKVFGYAARALDCDDIDAFIAEMGRAVGPPWQARHKQAAAAAIAALMHPLS